MIPGATRPNRTLPNRTLPNRTLPTEPCRPTAPAAPVGPARGLVVVIEDETVIADVLRRYLTAAGFGVRLCGTGAAGLTAIRQDRPAAVVLDIGLPDMDGLDVCRRLRATGDWTPVLFVTARDEDIDRILGLEMGGDDYLVKPFNPRELVARVRAVLRRTAGPGATVVPAFRAGRVRIDPAERRVWVDPPSADHPGVGHRPGWPAHPDGAPGAPPVGSPAQQVALTATEFDLLLFLTRHPGRVFERSSLLSSVWGYSAAAGARTVDVHVAALRAKLGEASPIRTVRGVGYSVDTR